MSAISKQYMTEAEYLALERDSEIKHEYYHGEIFAMSGASRKHNLITANTIGIFHNQLRKNPCELYASDMRIRVSSTGLYTYPDISVACGEVEIISDELDTLLNPTLIVEVLSPSTESYDRGTKFQHYRTLDSLQEYVLISQDSARIESFTRQPGGTWVLREAVGLEAAIDLTSIQCTLALADVYEKITLPDEPMLPPPPSNG